MAYIEPTVRTTGDLITSSIWNQDIVSNIIAIKSLVDAAAASSDFENYTVSSDIVTHTADSDIHFTLADINALFVQDSDIASFINSSDVESYIQSSDLDTLNSLVGQDDYRLSIAGAYLPNDSSDSPAAGLIMRTSSGGTIKARWLEATFDADIGEFIMWQFPMPSTYVASTDTWLDIQYKMTSATGGGVTWRSALMAITSSDAQDFDADTFSSWNTSTDVVPGTAGYLARNQMWLSNLDSLAPDDHVVLIFGRNSTDAGDTAIGDAELVSVKFRYNI